MKRNAIHVPQMLREYCGDRSELLVDGATIAEIFDELHRSHSALYKSICDERGSLRPHINLFLNSDVS